MTEEVAWQWVTADQVITRKPCQFLGAELTPSGANADCSFYDGADTGGKFIGKLVAATVTTRPLKPPGPIPCYNGLFVAVGSNVAGVLVYWRPIPWKERA